MRVTTNAFNNGFLNSYNSLLSDYLKTQKRVLTQKRYTRASEDSAAAAKAVHVRKALANLDIYDDNLGTAKDFFYAAEDALYDIANKTYLDMEQKVISVQDTMSQTELNILATDIEQFANHMIQDMNTDFASKQMFGAASNDKTPFTVYERVEIEYTDANGNAVTKIMGDIPDSAVNAEGNPIKTMTVNEKFFYDMYGNVICPYDDFTDIPDGTEIYTSYGMQYPAEVSTKEDGTRCLITNARDFNLEETGNGEETPKVSYPSEKNVFTVYYKDLDDPSNPANDKFYDAGGNEVDTSSMQDGDTYYDKYGNKLTVNGRADTYGIFSSSKIVCYNDVPVALTDDEVRAIVNGGTLRYYAKASDTEPAVPPKTINCPAAANAKGADLYPGSNPVFVDIGLGVKYKDDGTVVPSTALDMSLNGAELTGCGIDKEGDCYNLMQIAYDVATALRNGDVGAVNKFIDKLEESRVNVLNGITTLGVKQTTMQMYMDRNDVYRLSLSEKQNTLEGTDIEKEITNLKTIEAAYNASLSMGGNILPKSIFDFV